jgi:hypothetical protein
LSLQLQAARLGLHENRPSRGRWLLGLLGRSSSWMVQHVRRHLLH